MLQSLKPPTGVLATARLSWTLSTPPRHPLNTNSTSENPNRLCVLLKRMPQGLFLIIFWSGGALSLCVRDTLAKVKKCKSFTCGMFQTGVGEYSIAFAVSFCCYKNLLQASNPVSSKRHIRHSNTFSNTFSLRCFNWVQGKKVFFFFFLGVCDYGIHSHFDTFGSRKFV